MMSDRFRLSAQPIDEPTVSALVGQADAGGVVTFVGRVRDNARGRSVTALEYDAYPEMAEAVFARIADEATQRFAIKQIAVHHRSGRLGVGDIAVVVAVSAAHRGDAFAACEYVIDQLKTRAPIWKKEFATDGAVWVEENP
jgi:molybdopterin synthase catalytic subunit